METLGKIVVRSLAIIGACTVVSCYLDCKKKKEALEALNADSANKEKESND